MKHTLITIEGTDGCGKKTQTEALYNHLKAAGHNVIKISFPNYDSPSSAPVQMYLGGEFGKNPNCLTAHQSTVLYAVDRLCTMKKLYATLTEPTIIISDRYMQSNLFHQTAKFHTRHQQNAFIAWNTGFEVSMLDIPPADVVIFLDVPVETSARLAQERSSLKIGGDYVMDIHESDLAYLRRAYQTGKYVADKLGWAVIPCTTAEGDLKSVDDIHKLVRAEVEGKLK